MTQRIPDDGNPLTKPLWGYRKNNRGYYEDVSLQKYPKTVWFLILLFGTSYFFTFGLVGRRGLSFEMIIPGVIFLLAFGRMIYGVHLRSKQLKMPEAITIGKGNLDGKGVFASKDFKKGETVICYHLQPLTKEEYYKLPDREKQFVHRHRGTYMLYGIPERYVNHSHTPNTYQDLNRRCDIALKDIKKGEMITTDSSKDDI